VRTYSHAILTAAVARTAARRTGAEGAPLAAAALLGSVLPDLPAGTGMAWVGLRRFRFGREVLREEVCSRRRFATPDAALHSALPVAALLPLTLTLRRGGVRKIVLAFVLGWAGHVVVDALTHGEDARPVLWPLSGRRFRSPVSYWEQGRHARAFTLVEHAIAIAVAARLLREFGGRRGW
jgi:membrane-bound metal-dependent hydrolase YbcI (DUF457 family)